MLKPISTSDWISDSVVDTSRWSFGFQHTSAGNRCRMMHSFKRLPPVITSTQDKNIGILCSDWPWSHCGKLWRLVDMKVSCVSLLTAGIHAQKIKRQTCYKWQKKGVPWQWHIFCGISSLHPFVALVRCIRYGKFARFTDYLVCLFWPQVLTPSRSSSRSWWINVCKYLFWLEIYCLLSLNYHLDLHRLSTHMVCLTRRKKGIEAERCCSRDCCWCCR